MDNLLEKIKGSGAVLIEVLASAIESSLERAGFEHGLQQSLTVTVVKELCSVAGGRQFYLPAHWRLEEKFKYYETHYSFEAEESVGLIEIYEIIREALTKTEVEQKNHHATAKIIVAGISCMAGGRLFYIPVGGFIERISRDSEIFREFTGRNVRELAKKYRLSEISIRNIVKKKIKEERDAFLESAEDEK